MGGYLASFGLLLIMLYLMVRPFVVAAPATAATAPGPGTTPHAATPRAGAAGPSTMAAATATVAATGDVIDVSGAVASEGAAEEATDGPAAAPAIDVRSKVEAAIAARKAALRTVPCVSCGAALEPGDAFCRSCGGSQVPAAEGGTDGEHQEEASS